MAEDKNNVLIGKLDELEGRFVAIEEQLSDPAMMREQAKIISLSKEQGKLRPMVTKYRQYKEQLKGIADAQGDACRPADRCRISRPWPRKRQSSLKSKVRRLLESIKDTLVMADDAAIDSVIMEIRAGTGGEEAALFARDLYNMYTRYAEKRGWKMEQMDFSVRRYGRISRSDFQYQGAGRLG